MDSGVVFNPSPWGVLLYEGRAAGFEPELVKLAPLPRYQWAIPALVIFNWFKEIVKRERRGIKLTKIYEYMYFKQSLLSQKTRIWM
jgi:hypothetical protein